jgi:DNA primase
MTAKWSPAGHVDVEHLLEILELENIKRSGHDEWVFSCPYEAGHAHGDKNPSAGMNDETTLWNCRGCHRKGDAVTLVSSLMNISPVKARRLLREAYDPSSLDVDSRDMRDELVAAFSSYAKERITPVNHPIDKSFLDTFATDWQEVAKTLQEGLPGVPDVMEYIIVTRWFEPDTLEEWEFGYDAFSRRLTFAVRNENGSLIGFKGRGSTDAKPKYLVMGDAPTQMEDGTGKYGFPRYSKGLVVYGADRVDPTEEVICVEGELNVVALWQMGYKNAVAVNGSSVSDTQLSILRKYDRIVFWFDDDDAGNNGMWGFDDDEEYGGKHHPGVLEKLASDVDMRVVQQPHGDAGEYLQEGDQEGLEDLLNSAETYDKLLLRRRLVGS